MIQEVNTIFPEMLNCTLELMIKKIFWYFLHTQPQNNDFVVT
jgi:hypothetical protein